MTLCHTVISLYQSQSTFRFISRAVCSSYSTLNLRQLSFFSGCRSDLEQSSTARHICAVTSRPMHSLEDILLRTVLFIKLLTCLRSDIVILDTLIVLLTYLLYCTRMFSGTVHLCTQHIVLVLVVPCAHVTNSKLA